MYLETIPTFPCQHYTAVLPKVQQLFSGFLNVLRIEQFWILEFGDINRSPGLKIGIVSKSRWKRFRFPVLPGGARQGIRSCGRLLDMVWPANSVRKPRPDLAKPQKLCKLLHFSQISACSDIFYVDTIKKLKFYNFCD